MIFVNFLVICAVLVPATLAGSSSTCEPLVSNFVEVLNKVFFVIDLRKQLDFDYQKYVGTYSPNFIYAETNNNFEVFSKFLANLTAVTANVSVAEVLAVINGSLYPPPSSLDCIYDDLIKSMHIIEYMRSELLSSIGSAPSRDDLSKVPCYKLKAWYDTEVLGTFNEMLTRTGGLMQAEIAIFSDYPDLMYNFEVSRLQNQTYTIFLADFLQVQREIIEKFLSGQSLQLPSTVECLSDRILILFDRFMEVSNSNLEGIKKKTCKVL